jgi:hypothetical protein
MEDVSAVEFVKAENKKAEWAAPRLVVMGAESTMSNAMTGGDGSGCLGFSHS